MSHSDHDAITVRDPTFTLEIDGYLDARASNLGGAFSLSSGSHQPFLDSTWDPSRQQVVVRPLDPLRPTLRYVLEVKLDALRGLGGALIEGTNRWEFVVDSEAVVTSVAEATALSFEEDVYPLIWEHCGCHWEPQSQLSRLDLDSLREQASERPGRRLVEPYDAASSYLLEKILIDYPDRFGTQMPPPWSDEVRLSRQEVRVIRDWIEAGAAP